MREEMPIETTEQTPARKAVGYVVTVVAVGYALFHLWLAGVGVLSIEAARHLNLIGSMVLIFLLYPLSKKGPQHWTFAIDILFVVLALAGGLYLQWEVEELVYRQGTPNDIDMVFGIITICLTFEIARRMIGLPIIITVGLFLAYVFFGNYIPGYWGHRGPDLYTVVDAFYVGLEGIYGSPLGVVVEFVVLFVLFGSFLQKTGAGGFFIELAYALTGRMRGGAAKTAVVASALMGSISGSATANVVTTGSFTIPMMKENGYPAHIAAGTECASSVGGVLLPPIMGAAAFLIVGLTGIPYLEVIKAAALPAILYFVSVYAQSHFTACRLDLRGQKIGGDYWVNLAKIIFKGLPYLIPLAILIYVLISGYSAQYAAFTSIVAMIVTSFFRKETRLTPRKFIEALESGAKNALPVAAACAAVGMIVGSVDLTGVGIKFSALITHGTGGSLFLGICLVGLASLVLGIELPISASYLVVAILAAPALLDLGVPMIVAHLICLWFAIDAAVTPPVCITSYVAAGVANANPFKTAIAGWKMAKGLYVIPFLMAYTPITGNGTATEIIIAFGSGALGLISLAAAWDGWFVIKATVPERLLLAGVVVTAIAPSGTTDVIGLGLFVLVLVMQIVRWYLNREKATAEVGSP